jgi:hypothetical protein
VQAGRSHDLDKLRQRRRVIGDEQRFYILPKGSPHEFQFHSSRS